MSEPWTPGPWKSNHLLITAGRMDLPTWKTVAVVESKADGPLIAAAPEMAELLGDFYVWAVTRGNSNDLTDRARALLSRIRGEAEVPA